VVRCAQLAGDRAAHPGSGSGNHIGAH
jgi:hypothetical protein